MIAYINSAHGCMGSAGRTVSPLVVRCLVPRADYDRHVAPGTLQIYKYHGQSRVLQTSRPLEHDIVVSTYRTAASEHSRDGMLSRFHWYRLILDEGRLSHEVKLKIPNHLISI